MTKKTYGEKLKDPRWQKKRLEILNRDEFTCQICDDKETELHIHHWAYSKGNPWDVEDNNLVTLCKSCHALVEFVKKENEVFVFKVDKCDELDNGEILLAFYVNRNGNKGVGVYTYDFETGEISRIILLGQYFIDRIYRLIDLGRGFLPFSNPVAATDQQ